MSFESGRSMGRASTLIILIGTLASPLMLLPLILFRASFPAMIVFAVLFGVLGFAGQILFLVSMSRLANFYKKPAIFKNALYGFLTSIIGGSIMVLVFLGLFLTFFQSYPFNPIPSTSQPVFFSIFLVIGVVLIFSFIVALVQSLFYRQAFNYLAEESRIDHFRTAGLLMLIGGALTIVMVGGLVVLIGWIFAAMGFFAMQTPAFVQPSICPEISPRFCSKCGYANSQADFYCARCGNKLT